MDSTVSEFLLNLWGVVLLEHQMGSITTAPLSAVTIFLNSPKCNHEQKQSPEFWGFFMLALHTFSYFP